MSGSAIVIDVRTKAEWVDGHVEGAMLLPLENIMNNQLPDLPKDTKINLYCRSGNRSGLAVRIFKQNGFSNVENTGSLNEAAARFGNFVRGE